MEVNRRNCTGCGICLDGCPEQAIHMPREMACPEPVDGKCIGCMECIQAEQPVSKIELKFTFENVASGRIPANWKVEATNQRGPLATWQELKDTTAPSGKNVLALTSPNHTFGGTFNLCWSNQIQFLNGVIKVHFKANTGIEVMLYLFDIQVRCS